MSPAPSHCSGLQQRVQEEGADLALREVQGGGFVAGQSNPFEFLRVSDKNEFGPKTKNSVYE